MPFFFGRLKPDLAHSAVPTLPGTPYTTSESIIADHFAQFSEPEARPGELDAQDRETQRDNYNSGARCDNHDYADHDYRSAHDRDDNTARRFVR